MQYCLQQCHLYHCPHLPQVSDVQPRTAGLDSIANMPCTLHGVDGHMWNAAESSDAGELRLFSSQKQGYIMQVPASWEQKSKSGMRLPYA